MWVFPLLASGVAFAFAGRLFADYLRRRQPYQLAWAIALAMYGVASFVVVLGGLNGWSDREFAVTKSDPFGVDNRIGQRSKSRSLVRVDADDDRAATLEWLGVRRRRAGREEDR